MKKFISILCSLALICSIIVPTFAASTAPTVGYQILTVQEVAAQTVTPEMLETRSQIAQEYPGLTSIPLNEIDPNEEIISLNSIEDLDQIMSGLNAAPYYRGGYDFSKFVDNYLESLSGWDEENTLTVASSAYGDAPAYHRETSEEINCYGYAADFNWWILPGDIYYTNGSQWTDGSTVSEVADWVEKDFSRADQRPIRRITSATASVTSTERRICTRVGDKYVSISGAVYRVSDFHFMMQINTGKWAHKPGSLPSMATSITNPSSKAWDMYGKDSSGNPVVFITGFYDSTTVYFAI